MAGIRPDQHFIEGTFEIEHGPWIFLCGLKQCLAIRIYSSDNVDPSTGKGLESDAGYPSVWKLAEREKFPVMKGRINLPARIIKFKLKFKVVKEFESPGAFVVENKGNKKFFLKSATLRYIVPKQEEEFHFNCNSWVYPLDKTKVKRVFFINRLYLPRETPHGLKELRKKELEKLRGGGSQGERKPWDRIYQYDFYNDLGDPDNGREYSRPVLGGSDRPYPRRLRTGRPPCQQDHLAESRPAGCSQMYVPPDERLSNEKLKELKNNFVDALVRFLTPKSDHPALLFQEYPDLIKKFVRIFIPSVAFSPAAFRRFQSFVHFFTRKPKSAPNQDTRNLDSIDDIFNIFSEKEVKKLEGWVAKKLEKLVPNDILKQVVDATAETKKGNFLNSQIPSIIAEDKYAWINSDEEFGRQMIAGTNPVRIRLLKESEILSGIQWFDARVNERWFREAQRRKEVFILDHSDYLLPYLDKINGNGSVCAHATRTFLSSSGGTIEPVAIELRLPDSNVRMGCCYVDGPVWLLAKAHVAANDAAHHQLVSHWLHTHAVIEPFIIATRRQLSVMHPIHRLLDPHFKDTLHINALARAIFLNAGGILERTHFTGEFSMSLSSDFYKEWRFDKQALPTELMKRGMAEKEGPVASEISEKPAEKEPDNQGLVEREDAVERDEGPDNGVKLDDDKSPDKEVTSPSGVKLILEDYPYAKDGLEIWDAIEKWVREYCKIFYARDGSIKDDEEIQAWWKEIRNEGHGDQKEGWYELKTHENLVRALTTLIWITSGLHAAVNFGQYAYAGWPPNRPMLLRKFVPQAGTQEFKDLGYREGPWYPSELTNLPPRDRPDYKYLIQMLPEKFQMEFVIAVMDLLSRHTSEEVYLGQRPPENKEDQKGKKVNEESEVFRKNLVQIEKSIKKRNKRNDLMNRWGDAKIPYKLLLPDTSKAKPPPSRVPPEKEGIIGRGIPNNISI